MPSPSVHGAGPTRRSGRPLPKLAERVADRIVSDVVAAGWPVGQVLGSESELLARYDVSRAVFREAVRLVERQQVARMRRGPRGGLVVTEPTIDTIIEAVVLHLSRVDARLDEVFEARVALEELVTELVPGRMRELDLLALRRLAADESEGTVHNHRAMHSLLARATGNPALELFVEILNQVMLLYLADAAALSSATLAETTNAHVRIADAVIEGNATLARRRMRRHLEAEAAFLRGQGSGRQVLDPAAAVGTSSTSKRAEEVAREISRGVVSRRLVADDLIGSEPELMRRFDASRAVVREAVRLLEHSGVASMRRGPGGGLRVSEPDTARITDAVALHLERKGIRGAAVFEVRMGVELELVDLAIGNLDEVGAEHLRRALDAERQAPTGEFVAAAHELHAAIARASGNRVLELLATVLIRLSRLHQVGELSDRTRTSLGPQVTRTHAAIAEALIVGDRELARHRMARHLDALSSFFR